MVKTFIEWLRSTRKQSQRDAIRDNKIAMFKSFADKYEGTCDYDLNGLWLTAARRVEVRMRDDT
jgi:hypothetical protein